MRLEGKLTNSEGELIASGPCEINHDRAEVTMWPSWELQVLERERGPLSLVLSDGRELPISERHLTFKLRGGADKQISVYRLRVLERVPKHLASGYAEPAAAQEIAELVRQDEARAAAVQEHAEAAERAP